MSLIHGVLALGPAIAGWPHQIASEPTKATPTAVWTHAVDGWGEPAVDGDSIYLLTREHAVAAVDATTGAVRWRVTTGGGGDGILGSAIHAAGDVVVAADGDLIGLDRRDGRSRWRFAGGGGGAIGPFLGSADSTAVLVGSADGRLFSLERATGRVRWTRRVGGSTVIVFAPARAERSVVTAYRSRDGKPAGGVVALDESGRRRWEHRLPPAVAPIGAPAIVGTRVAVAGSDGRIRTWDTDSGRAGPVLPAPAGVAVDGFCHVRPLVASRGLLISGSSIGVAVAHDIETGTERWRYVADQDVAILRLRTDGETIYASLTDRTIAALDTSTGAERWRIGGSRQPIDWAPAIRAGRLYAVADDALLAMDLPREPAPRRD
jgi:outer membrane protein assembly factor BamB